MITLYVSDNSTSVNDTDPLAPNNQNMYAGDMKIPITFVKVALNNAALASPMSTCIHVCISVLVY